MTLAEIKAAVEARRAIGITVMPAPHGAWLVERCEELAEALEVIAHQGKAAQTAYQRPREARSPELRGLPLMFTQAQEIARAALARLEGE